MNPSKTPSPAISHYSIKSQLDSLANQICDLTHSVDRLEQLAVVVPVYHDSVQLEIDVIHRAIAGLNGLYTELEKVQLDILSLQRRLKWAQPSAEKHHNGNIAACEREVKVRDALANLLDCAELNQDDMEDETRATIDAATRVLLGTGGVTS